MFDIYIPSRHLFLAGCQWLMPIILASYLEGFDQEDRSLRPDGANK
jgi:hypothetical protein